MKNSYVYNAIKKDINQDHSIFMFGPNDSLFKSSYTLVKESKESSPEDAACFFPYHELAGLPAIIIYINDEMFKDPFDKVIALCHEYGHFLSWAKDKEASNNVSDWWEDFGHSKTLTEKQKRLMMQEEQTAWKNGRLFLKKYLPLSDSRWKRFNNTKRSCLRHYAYLKESE